MYKIFADNTLIYDSRLEDYPLISGEIELELNKSGSFTFSIYNNNPGYTLIEKMKTIIRVYKNNILKFRGRVINDEMGFDNLKTFTCEGELGFLLDSVQRPYTFQGTPADLLEDYLTNHNSQVADHQKFVLGTITVTDPNDYINRSNTAYENTLTNINDRLLDTLGGYFYISHNDQEQPVLNWYADSNFLCLQTIEFGENLLDFAKTDSTEEIATAIIPLGAEIDPGDAGEPYKLTIAEVNDGKDYVYDADAVAKYGWIYHVEEWSDVTIPANLKTKAEQLLAEKILRNITVEVNAIDLSAMDKNIDDFNLFEYVNIKSAPHNLEAQLLLEKQTLDLLHPENDTITLGYSYNTFTGESAGNAHINNGLADRVESIEGNYVTNTTIQSVTQQLQTLINQTSEAIQLMVSQTYVTNDQMTEQLSTTMTQLNNSFNFEFQQIQQIIDQTNEENRVQFEDIRKYIRFENGDIVLGQVDNEFKLRITKEKISFYQGAQEIAYLSNSKLYITYVQVLNSLQIGGFAIVPRENGNLAFKVV